VGERKRWREGKREGELMERVIGERGRQREERGREKERGSEREERGRE
jgi:hypothetical protein